VVSISRKSQPSPLFASKSNSFQRLPQFWSSIKERLSMTGHREGVPLPRGKPGWRLFVEDGALDVWLPRVKVIYRALGDTLTIYMAAIE
jgi:hypothetical protein